MTDAELIFSHFHHPISKTIIKTSELKLKMEHSETIILGTSNFRAPFELLFSVFEDNKIFLR